MQKSLVIGALGLMISGVVQAEEAPSAFVEANILGIFYHELGHALVDIEELPIFGQEEDAADVFSIFLIDALFEDGAAKDIAYEAAFGFLGEAAERGADIPWWDVHGPDEQRFYNTVCIFYGADPDSREALAEELGLPEERAETCPEEYDQANESWGAVLEDLVARGQGNSLVFEGDAPEEAPYAWALLEGETAALKDLLTLSDDLAVRVAPCGEANAFYDPGVPEIVFCAEFEPYLTALESQL